MGKSETQKVGKKKAVKLSRLAGKTGGSKTVEKGKGGKGSIGNSGGKGSKGGKGGKGVLSTVAFGFPLPTPIRAVPNTHGCHFMLQVSKTARAKEKEKAKTSFARSKSRS
jgi:hypothetical protein